MPWPLSQDYNEAIQSPRTSFADPELRESEAVVGPLGLPLPHSGNFADVYQLRGPDGSRWAVKCFTRGTPGLRGRYVEISRHLEQAKLPFMVDFTYLESGICVFGQWYPVVMMRWIEGLNLNQFVARYLDRPAMLDALAQIWQRMGRRLREASVAHGDLQHGNVLLVSAENPNALALKLIDYDGMSVPALAAQPSGEAGHPAYQHPQRLREAVYGPDVDRFSLLLVATALRALCSGGPALWEKFDMGDNLLFREGDLRDPGRSPLIQELLHASDAETRTLTAALRAALERPVEATPTLDQVLSAVPTRPTFTPVRIPKDPERPVPVDADARSPRSLVPAAILVAGVSFLCILLAGASAGIYLAVRAMQPGNTTARRLAEQVASQPARGTESSPPESPPASEPPGPAVDPDPHGPIEEIRRLTGHTGEIRRLALSPDGRRLLTAGWDRTIRLWDTASGKEIQHLGNPTRQIHTVAFLPDGRRALSGGDDGKLHLWDLTDGHEIRTFEGQRSVVFHLAVSPNGRQVLSCGPGDLVLWDVETGSLLRHMDQKWGTIESVTFSADGKRIAAGAAGAVHVCEVETDRELRSFKQWAGVMGVAFSADGSVVLSSGADSQVREWQVEDGELRRSYKEPGNQGFAVAYSPDGDRILSGGTDSLVRLWDEASGKLLHTYRGHSRHVWTLAFSPDGRVAYSAGQDGIVHVWRLPPAGYSPPEEPAATEQVPPKPVVEQPPPKPLVPEGKLLADMEHKVREDHRLEYSKHTAADMKALAEQLLKEAGENQRSSRRYVVLREARDLAARAGDLVLAFRAVDQLTERFDVKPLELKAQALELAIRAARSSEVYTFAAMALSLSDTAEEADQYETAKQLARVALEPFRMANSPVFAAADRRVDETHALVLAWGTVRSSFATLLAHPEDPAASLAVGRFHALVRGDWDRGLPLLARGDDSTWKSVALEDLGFPADPQARLHLARRYAALAETGKQAAHTNLAWRACYWYELAETKLPKEQREPVAREREDLAKHLLPLRPVILEARYGAQNTWADETEPLRERLSQSAALRLEFKGLAKSGLPGPAAGRTLVVLYRNHGGIHLCIAGEKDNVHIPARGAAPDTEPGKPDRDQYLAILHARYGAEGTFVNVVDRVQRGVNGTQLTVSPRGEWLGDPFPNHRKALVIVYRDAGRVRLGIVAEGEQTTMGPPNPNP